MLFKCLVMIGTLLYKIIVIRSCIFYPHVLLTQKLKRENLSIVFPPSDFTTCSLCNKLNADLFKTIRCKTVDKVKKKNLQITKRSRPKINCRSRKCLNFFHRVQIRQFGSQTDWFATKEKGNFSATTAAGNSHARWQERQDKYQDPTGTDSCCSANSNQKMTLFTLFWLVYPLLMFFFSPMIPENLTYLM